MLVKLELRDTLRFVLRVNTGAKCSENYKALQPPPCVLNQTTYSAMQVAESGFPLGNAARSEAVVSLILGDGKPVSKGPN